MQATFRQQFSHGLTSQVAYTFSKALTNTTVYNDQRNLDLAWARTSFDRTHRLITNFTFDLPNLGTNGLMGGLLEGWSISGIVIVQSGGPVSLIDRSGGLSLWFRRARDGDALPGRDKQRPGHFGLHRVSFV